MAIDYSRFPRTSMEDFINGVPPHFPTSPVVVKTPEQLEGAVKQHADTIIIEGDLANNIRLEATGKASLAVAIGAICVKIAQVILGAIGGSHPSFTNETKGKYLVEEGCDRRIVLKQQ